jgi:transposase
MPAALPLSMREEIVRRRQHGETFRQIARELKVSYAATRRIWARFTQEGDLKPHYDRCRPPEVRKAAELHKRAVELKESHPRWGAGLIRLELSEEFQSQELPSERTLQRWFRRAGVGPRRGDSQPRVKVKWGRVAHEVWAMDAKEQIRLDNGEYVSWLTITDEGSGAVLSATLFPHSPLGSTRPIARQAGDPADDDTLGTARSDAHG